MAQNYLKQQGLSLVMANYTCRLGEIDLIMETTTGVLVFIEVRKRVSGAYGGALHSVTQQKQKKLIKTAMHYLTTHPHARYQGMRFDVVAIEGPRARINWVQDAFEAYT